MQPYHHIKSILLLFLTLSSSGCALQRMVRLAEKKQEVTVQPSPLAVSGQAVNFEMKVQVPEKLIRKNEHYKLDVYYENMAQQRENIGSFKFEEGEFVYENGKPTIVRQFSFPYTPDKSMGRLLIQGAAIDKEDGDVLYTKEVPVAKGLITTPLLLVRNNAVDYLPDVYSEGSGKPDSLVFHFAADQAKLPNNQGPALEVLEQYALDNVGSQQIVITGSQSPEESGSGLANKRAKVLEDYYRQKLKTLDYSGKKVNIQTRVPEDNFELLKKQLKASALPEQDRQEVTAILDSTVLSKQEMVKALQQTRAYDYLQQYVYPRLRAAAVEVNYNRRRKPDYELFVLAQGIAAGEADADELTEEELLHAASLTPLLDEKRRLYEAAVKTTDKWPAYYNLGVVYSEMARKEYRPAASQALLAKAIENLAIAGSRHPTAHIYYSLASAYHQQGQFLEALQHYDNAIKLGAEEELLQRLFADKAALEIAVGQYDDAMESLRYAGDSYQAYMNLGLTYLLQENYDEAERYYTRALALKPNDALAYYNLALLGARTQNEQLLEQNLRKAVQADKAFMQKAINDLEFEAYRDKAAYQDALMR
ncbi:tetratricopeptide repeat protein [Pontibacter ummariensis]|uniref:Tetratricopeptide repeat-containing protein n=1 Tax=Pontibacter ummariensis TaxID=1610492 RepID=A0A239FFK3_9BACT|nr:tetratricopeptide repeat protein [Pontibacter ummariensis]PRY12300.1 tetratricopeptide repeat protein [Pontibacter ummariensis]SNS55073.1 Tetratricopeptide repeat-containing protein [Pontibacter ummariensis]